jgi:hypothetical protein
MPNYRGARPRLRDVLNLVDLFDNDKPSKELTLDCSERVVTQPQAPSLLVVQVRIFMLIGETSRR